MYNTTSKNWAIDLVGISKSYQNQTALINVTIKWKEGVLGLIGPNGSGKSTLIKILCSILRPNKGYARIFGKDVITESLEVKRRIGVLFENPTYHPNLKVLSSLCWIGELRGLSHEIAEKKVRELLEYFELERVLNSNLKELSAGMRQKYGLIFATVGTPPLIILDEPTSNLDPDARRLYKMYVNRLVKENNCSFLISSHVLEELERICNGFVFLFQGVVVESGNREDLQMKIPTQRFRIITKNPQILVPILKSEGIEIESIEQTEIIFREKTFKKLIVLESRIQQKGLSDQIEIIKLESEIEAIYRRLSDQHKKREYNQP